MTISNALSLFFVIGVLLASDLRAENDFRFDLTPAKIRPGERATLTIEIPAKDAGSEIPTVNDELLSQNQEFTILEKEFKEEEGKYVFRLSLTAYKLGVITLPPVEVRQGPNSHSTEALSLTVETTRLPTDPEVREDFGEISPPLPWTKWLFIFGGSLALFFAIKKGLLKLKGTAPKRRPVITKPEEDPLIWLRRQLDQFFSSLSPADTLPSPKSDQLLEIVRHYFAKTSKSPVRAWTPEEFKTKLAKDRAAQEIAERMKRWSRLHYGPKGDTKLPLDSVVGEIEKVLLP